MFWRGVKYPEKVINHSKTTISLMMCGSASGVLLPPYVIYKSEGIMNPWRQNGLKEFHVVQEGPVITEFHMAG